MEIQELARIISSSASTEGEICSAGVRLFCVLFSAEDSKDLTSLRHLKLQNMIATCSRLEPEKLPPTNRAAHFHAIRVHLLITTWSHLEEDLDPLEFGWQKGSSGLQSVMTDLPPAPDEVLKFVRCKCKSTKNRCRNNQCSCRKNGLKCVEVCGGCRGVDCQNTETVDTEDDVDE